MAAKVTVIPLISIHTKDGLFQPGAEVTLPGAEAELLIQDGMAIPAAKQPAAAPEPKPAPEKKEAPGAA